MNQLIHEVQRDLQLETNGRTISWEVKELPQVLGNPSMLRRGLRNLIENAFKDTKTRASAEIEISSTGDGHEVVFCVRDQGVGLRKSFGESSGCRAGWRGSAMIISIAEGYLSCGWKVIQT